MGVEAHNERKKDGHKMYGRSEKCIQKDGSWINGRFAKKKGEYRLNGRSEQWKLWMLDKR